MSAEVPTPAAEQPLPRSQVVKSNRRQVLLFALLTLVLSVATVWGGRVWVRNSETLTIAVGEPKSEEAVLGEGDNNVAFVRNILDMSDGTDAASRVQLAGPGSTLDKLFGSDGFGAVIAIGHASKVMKDKSYEQYAKRGGFTLNAIDEAKALARKIPGISEETLSTGMLSSSPEIPDDDLDTHGLQCLLVAQSRIPTTTDGA